MTEIAIHFSSRVNPCCGTTWVCRRGLKYAINNDVAATFQTAAQRRITPENYFSSRILSLSSSIFNAEQ